ncbi:MT-A70 family methyltransferase [Yersinia thracica]|uniref:MT-A70 family methyltransferase n=1 Tax=Yersinia thracica TaxID=2890319 RepID=UPI001643AFF3|nr:MT-A70 family methyltransferase [Yersinia thracica]
MRYGSVCSGIEAASLAWEPLGWSAAWFSEIEPFPSAVLAYRWPTVTNLGDMTKIAELVRSGSVEAPDILVGGTPCQAFSVAGLRNGLADARGQLTLSYVELADAIDETRRERGEKESIIVWENVPGVLSSKDNAFGCFLAALAGEDEPLVPSGEKWTNAGYVSGPKRAIAWIIKDAQYFGVAQRRRRVFVVASARADVNPAQVLFEFDGLRRDIAPVREAGKAVAALTANGVGTCGADDNQATAGHLVLSKAFRMTALGEYADDETASTCKARDYKDATDLAVAFNWQAAGNTSSSLGFSEISGTLQCNNVPAIIFQKEPTVIGGQHPNAGIGFGICPTLTSAMGVGGGHIPITHSPLYAFSYKDSGGDISFDISPTLRAGNSTESNANGGQPPAIIDGMDVRRLTVVECERLQGIPDNYTLIPHGKTKKIRADEYLYIRHHFPEMTEEEAHRSSADGPRYKAIGNSMAVNVMQWLGQRIVAVLPLPLYDVIYADPPWQYGSKPNRGVSLEYSTMPLTELCAMQVKSIANSNSALFMWVTGAMISEALVVGAAWGFKFIRVDKVWEKKKHTGSRHGVVGPWGMNDAEFLLLFTRGKVCGNQTERNQYTVYEEKYTGIHSGKPHFFREQIERRFKNARRIELFARTSSTGWDVWGDQAPNAKSLALIELEEPE